MSAAARTIVGIDPGSRLVGYAALRTFHPRPVHPRHFQLSQAGVISCPQRVAGLERIAVLHRGLYQLLVEIKPELCVIESSFIGINPRSALLLGQARGALIAACARLFLPVYELSPSEVKKTVTGSGNAGKDMVAAALKQLLGFDRQGLSYDVSDALAVALTFGLTQLTLLARPATIEGTVF